ncbi:MAG: DUF3048 C-terminal domain-containing protein [Anaerolineales bacterium]|nr:DUF3048 C-terminal domain-containing protein [Anaerolineales bacterium]
MRQAYRATVIKVFLTALLLGACGPAPAASPTSAPETTAAPTATTAPPSSTPVPASATPPEPTATPASATDTATVAPPPTETATPAAINPLTGLAVGDPAVLERRPLAIKVAHFPRHVRAAQVGLSLADNVWEHYAEGGTVRFTAIFLSQAPERIGNVRSARLIDIHLGYAYGAMVVASGSSSGTLARFREAGLYDRLIAEATGYKGCPILCREEAAAVTTDKLFTNAPALWALTTQLGLNTPQDLSGWAFDPAAPAGGTAASTVHIDFQLNNTLTEWRYDAASGRYARWIDTPETAAGAENLAPHVDTLTGEALTAANVVVIYAPYIPSNIWEEEGGTRHYSYDVVLTGSGPARLFRDGQMYALTWERAETTSGLPRLLDANGRPVALKPGNTWFEALDPDSPTTFADGRFQARSKVPDASALPTATP